MVGSFRDRVSIISASLAFAALVPGLARAADMPMAPPLDAVEEERVTFGTGWYLRGDIAAASEVKVAVGNVIVPTKNETFNSWSIGVGGGYKYNDWFRTDVTLDWRKPQSALGYRTTNLHVLFNGYLDLGTWFGLTPYVGAGVGFNSNWQKYTAGSYAPSFADYYNGGAIGAYYSPTGVSKRMQLAYAGMAGVSYAFAPHVSVDLGYRYLGLGTTQVFNAVYGLKDKRIDAHEVRLGLRYTPD